jgi:hypothetical protein
VDAADPRIQVPGCINVGRYASVLMECSERGAALFGHPGEKAGAKAASGKPSTYDRGHSCRIEPAQRGEMGLGASHATTARHLWNGLPQVSRWLSRRRSRIDVVLSITLALLAALGPLTALGQWTAQHGSAGKWYYLSMGLPQGWAMGVVTYTVLRPDLVSGSRGASVWRWLRWSTLFALSIEQIPLLYYYRELDILLLSGWLVFLVGLELAGRAPVKLRQAVRRLESREVLGPAERVEDVLRGLEPAGRAWAAAGGWCVAGALLATSPLALLAVRRPWVYGVTASDLALLVAAGGLAGSWLGRMIGYARVFGQALRREDLHLRVILGHPDGAGGLEPIGDFNLYQSLTASLPAIFLGVWMLLISLGGANRYLAPYRLYLDQYLWLLPLAILFEILVFVLPMNSVHLIMKSWKEHAFLARADRLSPAIAAAQARLDSHDNGDPDAARQLLTQLTERYQELQNAPSWPVDSSIRRRFTWRNLGLLIPFIGFIIGHLPFWQQVSDVLRGLAYRTFMHCRPAPRHPHLPRSERSSAVGRAIRGTG